MEVIERKLAEIIPYENNPRNNEDAVDKVAESLKEFGWQQPIVVDSDGVVIAGHTRLKAAQKLGMETAPVVVADGLTDEQVRAYRLADNKTGEFAGWNFEMLNAELFEIDQIDMEKFGFDMEQFTDAITDGREFFERQNRHDTDREEGNDEYNEFLDKFEAKKTTDDCYTPELVYEAVADWVANEYGLDRSDFVRPFYPGGDYQRFKYGDRAVVVDNPPFSILSEILQWYKSHGIKFFLFGPTLTLFSSSSSLTACAIPTGATVTYENGATVNTSFLTNLENECIRVRTAPTLYKAVEKANEEWTKGLKKEIPKYSYPDEIITSAMVARWSKYGIDQQFSVIETALCSALDAQKEEGKAIFGKGYLLSERAAAERAAARRWPLSEREREIVRSLGAGQDNMAKQNKSSGR